VIVVVGLSHRTASIDVRERIALDRVKIQAFLSELVQTPAVGEAFVVSTCNRVEVVAAARNGAPLEAVADACVMALDREAPGIAAHLYRRVGGEAVRHLFRVASSLDSLVLGEPQILGQVKAGFDLGRAAGSIGSTLHRSVPRALRAAKRVRSETAIGSGQVSVPSVAVDLTRQIFGELRGRGVLLVGSGEMAEAVARLLRGAGARLFVLGRNRERVEQLASEVGGEPRLWPDLTATLVEADVVITSTSAPGFVIDREQVVLARKKRRGRDQTYIDLAVPRDVEPSVNGIDGVFLYNIDDFSKIVAESLAQRGREAELAQRIIDEETHDYERWAEAEQATPTIVRLHEKLRQVLRFELERSRKGRLKHLSNADRQALELMLEAVENRLLHVPTMRLRLAAAEPETSELSLRDLSLALTELFDLSAPSESAEAASETSSPSASPSLPDEPPSEHNSRWPNSQ
jgi:glutamyl-tRNA reductase